MCVFKQEIKKTWLIFVFKRNDCFWGRLHFCDEKQDSIR